MTTTADGARRRTEGPPPASPPAAGLHPQRPCPAGLRRRLRLHGAVRRDPGHVHRHQGRAGRASAHRRRHDPARPASASRISRLTKTRQLWSLALVVAWGGLLAVVLGYLIATMGDRQSDPDTAFFLQLFLISPFVLAVASVWHFLRGARWFNGEHEQPAAAGGVRRPPDHRPAHGGSRDRTGRARRVRRPGGDRRRRPGRSHRDDGRRARVRPDGGRRARPAPAHGPGPQEALPDLRRDHAQADRHRVRRGRRGLRDHAGRDVRARGRVRLRQDDARAHRSSS